MFSCIADIMMRLLSKLIRLASKKVYYFSKILDRVYFIAIPCIPSIQAQMYIHCKQWRVHTILNGVLYMGVWYADHSNDSIISLNIEQFTIPHFYNVNNNV